MSTATAATALITQGLKELPFLKKLPTRLLSLIIAVLITELSYLFINGFSLSGFVLQIFNGILVSLSANGTYSAIAETKNKA